VNKNILTFDFSCLKDKVIVFGNIPYCISSPIIKCLIENRSFIKHAYLTCQKEFIDKLIAKPSTDDYVFLSCYLQYYAKITKIFDIPANAFSPIPKVSSTFAMLDFSIAPTVKAENEDFLFGLIKKAFANRRKKIINALRLEDKKDILLSCGIDPNLRPENISLKQYITLANTVNPK
jgi:16S rRNA (adenine1518-N6/adenine1519-N6)-dimethyltransferase